MHENTTHQLFLLDSKLMDRDLLHFLKMDENEITLWDLGTFNLKSISYNPFELFATKTINSYTPKIVSKEL